MKTIIVLASLIIFSATALTQENTIPKPKLNFKNTEQRDPVNNWSLNLMFSDNGFGAGATLFKQLSRDVSGFAGIAFSSAKGDREFEQYDIFGNSYIPFKVNRLFVSTISIGAQFRLFRDDVTDNLRPFITVGAAPTAVMYTPYDRSFFKAFGYAQAKYTVGAFAGLGMDYVSNKHSALTMNIRYYYINLFGQGVNSISTEEKNFFGGIYFVFSYTFMH